MEGEELISINEAVQRGISKLRREPWAPRGRIELSIYTMGDGKKLAGPWVTICDGATDAGVLEPQKTLIINLDMDEKAWEPWKGEDSAEHNTDQG